MKKVNPKIFASNVPIVSNDLHTIFFIDENGRMNDIDIHPSQSNRKQFDEFILEVNLNNVN